MRLFGVLLFVVCIAAGSLNSANCPKVWSEKWTVDFGRYLGHVFSQIDGHGAPESLDACQPQMTNVTCKNTEIVLRLATEQNNHG